MTDNPFYLFPSADAISDIPYYMTITISGPSFDLHPEATDYAISLEVMEA